MKGVRATPMMAEIANCFLSAGFSRLGDSQIFFLRSDVVLAVGLSRRMSLPGIVVNVGFSGTDHLRSTRIGINSFPVRMRLERLFPEADVQIRGVLGQFDREKHAISADEARFLTFSVAAHLRLIATEDAVATLIGSGALRCRHMDRDWVASLLQRQRLRG